MKKKYIFMIVFAISFLAFTFFLNRTFSFESKQLTTDSGFDSSWDSSGSDSGGYSGSDISDKYDSKKGSSGRSITLAEFGVSCIFSTITLLYCMNVEGLFEDKKTTLKIIYSILFILFLGIGLFTPLLILYEIFYGIINNLFIFIMLHVIVLSIFVFIKYKKYRDKKKSDENRLKEIEEYNLEESPIVKEAYTIYKRVQLAWMNDTIDDVSDIISDEMLNMYRAQLTTLRVKKQQNVMNNFKLVNGYIMNVKYSDNKLIIKVILEVDCKDYLIKKDTKKVVRGSSSKINHYNYSLKFSMPLKSLENCPNCGAELKKGGGITCPSCKSKVVVNNGKMILIDKKMNKQS